MGCRITIFIRSLTIAELLQVGHGTRRIWEGKQSGSKDAIRRANLRKVAIEVRLNVGEGMVVGGPDMENSHDLDFRREKVPTLHL